MTRDEVERLLIENEKLLYFIINREYPIYRDDEDAQQEGRIAMWKAIEQYDPEKGKLSTYIAGGIRNALHTYWRSQYLREKNLPSVSASTPITESGLTIDEVLVGDEDVDYFDDSEIFKWLSKREAFVVKARAAGYRSSEIGKALGITRAGEHLILKSARKKLERIYRREKDT